MAYWYASYAAVCDGGSDEACAKEALEVDPAFPFAQELARFRREGGTRAEYKLNCAGNW